MGDRGEIVTSLLENLINLMENLINLMEKFMNYLENLTIFFFVKIKE